MFGKIILLVVGVAMLGACGPPPSPKKLRNSEMAAARDAARRARSVSNNDIRHTWKKSGPVDDDDDDGEGEGEGE